MVCPECGMENAGDVAVCAGCGAELHEPEAKGYSKDFALASLVLGILSMLIFPYLYGSLAIVAAIFSKKQRYPGKMATIGLILGIIAFAGWLATQIIYSLI